MENLKKLFKNEAVRKILLFYNENPHCIDTAKGISIWIGCDLDSVQNALKRLVKQGILVNHKTASTDAYSYTNNRAVARKIERYL